jgi:hypothetical protein
MHQFEETQYAVYRKKTQSNVKWQKRKWYPKIDFFKRVYCVLNKQFMFFSLATMEIDIIYLMTNTCVSYVIRGLCGRPLYFLLFGLLQDSWWIILPIYIYPCTWDSKPLRRWEAYYPFHYKSYLVLEELVTYP